MSASGWASKAKKAEPAKAPEVPPAPKDKRPRKGWTSAARPTPEGAIPRTADGWPTQSAAERTLSLFAPEVLTPSPEEVRRAETHRKAEASARRKMTKKTRVIGEAFDDEQIRKFNERTGL